MVLHEYVHDLKINTLQVILFLYQFELFVCTSLSYASVCTAKWFNILLSNTNINHLFAHSEVVSSVDPSNSFIWTQLNDLKYCYLILKFNSILFI